jgi:iron complex outermembrane receptor protein
VHDNENISLFAHTVFDLTDRLSLTAGLRYSEDEKLVDFDNSLSQFEQDIDGKRTDWRLGLDYKFNEDVMMYTSASTGYRPGGYNPRPFQVTQQVEVDEEESTAYELGLKADLLDRRLRANVAAFYTDWSTRIVTQSGTECFVIPGSEPPTYNTGNPGDPGAEQDSLGNWCLPLTVGGAARTSRTFYVNRPGKVRGFEAELTWYPVAGLTINGSYGLLNWKSPDIDDDPNVLSNRPVHVPENNWSIGASYRFNLASGAAITPRFDVHGQSEICSQNVLASNVFPEASCADGYELINTRVQWDNPQRSWAVAFGVTNLADKTFFLNKFDLTAFGQPHAEGQPGRRREWYASFTRTFF